MRSVYFVDGPKSGQVYDCQSSAMAIRFPVMGRKDKYRFESPREVETADYQITVQRMPVFCNEIFLLNAVQFIGFMDLSSVTPVSTYPAPIELKFVTFPCPDFLEDIRGWVRWKTWFIVGTQDRIVRWEMARYRAAVTLFCDGFGGQVSGRDRDILGGLHLQSRSGLHRGESGLHELLCQRILEAQSGGAGDLGKRRFRPTGRC